MFKQFMSLLNLQQDQVAQKEWLIDGVKYVEDRVLFGETSSSVRGKISIVKSLDLSYVLKINKINVQRKRNKIFEDPIREAQILSELHKYDCHPSIVLYTQVEFIGDYVLLLFPYFQQGDLYTYWEMGRVVTSEIIETCVKQIGGALTYLHEKMGIVHLDVALENILIDEKLNFYLTDFGMAQYINKLPLVYHSSPEEVHYNRMDNRPLEYRCEKSKINANWKSIDAYALGKIMYNLYTSRNPNRPHFKLMPEEERNASCAILVMWQSLLHDDPDVRVNYLQSV
jgi:serine/threonine protein kinase